MQSEQTGRVYPVPDYVHENLVKRGYKETEPGVVQVPEKVYDAVVSGIERERQALLNGARFQRRKDTRHHNRRLHDRLPRGKRKAARPVILRYNGHLLCQIPEETGQALIAAGFPTDRLPGPDGTPVIDLTVSRF